MQNPQSRLVLCSGQQIRDRSFISLVVFKRIVYDFMYGFPHAVQLLFEDTQVETQSNNIKLDTIHYEFPWLWF